MPAEGYLADRPGAAAGQDGHPCSGAKPRAVPRSGPRATDQVRPSQWSISGLLPAVTPTAHALRAEMAATADS
jgi:hypothetical protein